MGRSELGVLRYREDMRTLGFGLCAAASILLQWQLRELRSESWLQFALLLLLTTFQIFQGGVSVHNSAHCPPFKGQFLNRLFFLCLTVWQGAPASAYVPGHNLSHHKYLQTRKDIMRTSKMKYDSQFLNLVCFFPTILKSINNNDWSYMLAQRHKGRPIWHWFQQELVLNYAVLLTLALLDWRKCLWIFFIPGVLAKDMLVTLNMLQHDGCDPKSKYDHSRNFTGAILNYLLFNNGYHTIHHMMPGVHWSLTKEKHDLLVEPHIHPNLLQPSILAYLARTFLSGQKRVNFDGTPYTDPGINAEDGPDVPWFYGQAALNASDSNPDQQSDEAQSFDEAVGCSRVKAE